MNFNRVNNIVGWLVFLIATATYVLTMERTGSFWDCGEFISTAFKLQIPHPPGAPLFVLLGRFFIILFGADPMNAALAVNFMNALASGFTILFLFWSITHFARKIVAPGATTFNFGQLFSIQAAGVVGALAYAWSDSFWYSAVEGEVYALSSLFTALVFWAILKWEHAADKETNPIGKFGVADKWLILIFYLVGLSIGIHLLNLLTIPAIVMVYYFKRYPITTKNTIIAFLVGCVLTGLTQVVFIQWSIQGAGSFDIFFVNTLGLPFFSGFGFYFVFLFVFILLGLRFTDKSIQKFSGFATWLTVLLLMFCFPFIKSGGSFVLFAIATGVLLFFLSTHKRKIFNFLQIGIWSTFFVILGTTTYFTTLIRSNANPSVDMYNVDNPVSLIGYLTREQYGDWPILYGPDYNYRPNFVDAGDQYIKGEDKYIVSGKKRKVDYSAKPSQEEIQYIIQQNPGWDPSKIGPHIFPRMYDAGTERQQDYVYRVFGNIPPGGQPKFSNNIYYFFNYQLNWMYGRYFFWNFAGRQNDLQGFGNSRDGNWITGIKPVDNLFGKDGDDILPSTAGKDNKANNKFYAIPFILGLIGFFFQLRKNKQDWLVATLLFFFTGIAIVVYLNQAGFQPRERDYAFVGSFYAFAIWIGLSVLWIQERLQKFIPSGNTAKFVAAAAALLAAPILMVSQTWDDHDRGEKYLARDLGKSYLESTAENALLLTFGDNDTYPLWFTQEVEGVRKDLRVINYSLLGTDWYINQLRYKLNESAPFDVIFTENQIAGNKRDVVFTVQGLQRYGYGVPPSAYAYQNGEYHDLYTLLKDFVGKDDPNLMASRRGDAEKVHFLPTTKVRIPVDIEKVKQEYKLEEGDSLVNYIEIDLNKSLILKNDLAVLAVIAANKWERPIYFTSEQELRELGLTDYVRTEGLTYRLVPYKTKSGVGLDAAYNNIMNHMYYGNAKTKGVYFDEENRRHINSMRQTHAIVANHLVDAGESGKAKEVLNKYDQNVDQENVPYGMTSNRGNFHNRITLQFLYAAYRSGDKALAEKVGASLQKDLNEQMAYYAALGNNNLTGEQLAMQANVLLNGRLSGLNRRQEAFAQDILSTFQLLMNLEQLKQDFGDDQKIENNIPLQ
jgi:hypothetical protein